MDCLIEDHDIVMLLIGAEDPLKDLLCLLRRGLLNLDGLETPLQSGVFLHILVILVKCRCADQLDLAPCKGRL